MKRGKPLVCLALSCCLASCWPGRGATTAPRGAKNSPIAVRRVFIRFPAYGVIGQHYRGDPPKPESPFYWWGGSARPYTALLLEALRKQGYTVTADTIARRSDDHAPRARFELHGTVTDVSENTYGAGTLQRDDAAVVVLWELYDVSRDTVVFSTSHRGAVVGSSLSGLLAQAFQESVGKLLSDPGFVARVGAPADERGDGTGGSRLRQRPAAAPR